jgi:RsiW-degrading membrane proteinase PrsW (M82 family)
MNLEHLKLLGAAVAPSAILLTLLNWRGRPWPPIVLALASGALAGVPAYYLEGMLLRPQGPGSLDSLASLLVLVMVTVSLVEEGCKLLGVYLGPARTRWYTEEYDGIAFAATVSLGFATVENILYIAHAAQAPGASLGESSYQAALHLALVRGLLSVPLHTCCGVIMGASLGQALVRTSYRWNSDDLPKRGLLLAVALHGAYDFFAFQNESVVSDLLTKVLVAAAVVWSFRACRAARRRSPSYGGQRMFLPPPVAFRAVGHGSIPVARRNPYIAGGLGIAPGLGQYYNGEPRKALAFVAIALFNVVLYYAAWLFVHHPEQTVSYMSMLGIVPNLGAHDQKEFLDKLAQATEQKWLLMPLVMSLCLLWEIIGAVEAFVTASQPPRRPQEQEVRRSFLPQGLGTSYVLHLLAVLMLVFTPVIHTAAVEAGVAPKSAERGGAAGGGDEAAKAAEAAKAEAAARAGRSGEEMLYVTWVEHPTRIDGYKANPEGKASNQGVQAPPTPSHQQPQASQQPSSQSSTSAPQGQQGQDAKTSPVTPRAAPDGRGPGLVVLHKQKQSGDPKAHVSPQPRPSKAEEPPKLSSRLARRSPEQGRSASEVSPTPGPTRGEDKTYNEYISYRIRVNDTDGYYFRHTPPFIYSVVEYTILKDGTLLDAHLIKTSGRPEDGERAVQVIRMSAPFVPLPGTARGIKITELFWTRRVGFPPGSIEEKLSRLPDGRYIQILE